MSDKLSFYMLVKNSEQYLDTILSRIHAIADEIILLDSGSQDQTRSIAEKWHAQWHFRPLDNFKNQRSFALSLCRHPHVLFLDADEIPDDELIKQIKLLKQNGFAAQAYRLRREWIALGKPVHSIYPVESPDFPIRLVNKNKVSFAGSTLVHESYSGYQSIEILPGKISHFTFHSRDEIRRKLNFYTAMASQDLAGKGKKFNLYRIIFNPVWAWVKWYFTKQGYRDGMTGIILANYAFRYTFLKYWKLRSNNSR